MTITTTLTTPPEMAETRFNAKYPRINDLTKRSKWDALSELRMYVQIEGIENWWPDNAKSVRLNIADFRTVAQAAYIEQISVSYDAYVSMSPVVIVNETVAVETETVTALPTLPPQEVTDLTRQQTIDILLLALENEKAARNVNLCKSLRAKLRKLGYRLSDSVEGK